MARSCQAITLFLLIGLNSVGCPQPQSNVSIDDERLNLVLQPEWFDFESEFGFVSGESLSLLFFARK